MLPARPPRVLALVGLAVVSEDHPSTVSRTKVLSVIEGNMELLAECAHDGWMDRSCVARAWAAALKAGWPRNRGTGRCPQSPHRLRCALPFGYLHQSLECVERELVPRLDPNRSEVARRV